MRAKRLPHVRTAIEHGAIDSADTDRDADDDEENQARCKCQKAKSTRAQWTKAEPQKGIIKMWEREEKREG